MHTLIDCHLYTQWSFSAVLRLLPYVAPSGNQEGRYILGLVTFVPFHVPSAPARFDLKFKSRGGEVILSHIATCVFPNTANQAANCRRASSGVAHFMSSTTVCFISLSDPRQQRISPWNGSFSPILRCFSRHGTGQNRGGSSRLLQGPFRFRQSHAQGLCGRSLTLG